MKPRFEEHEGKLFRMLDKPVPLTPDAEMPCLVRYIQDDSPMGRYLKRKYNMVMNTVAIVSRIGTDWRAHSSDEIFVDEVEVLEIIGYPIAEGSKEWALYQMMQSGNVVCHTKAPSIKYSMPTHYVKRKVREDYADDMSIQVWLSGADETGLNGIS